MVKTTNQYTTNHWLTMLPRSTIRHLPPRPRLPVGRCTHRPEGRAARQEGRAAHRRWTRCRNWHWRNQQGFIISYQNSCVYNIISLYLDLRKDTNKCPFPRFLPLGRISCEGAGNGHFLIIVVNFGFRAFWADLTLLCVKMCRFFWAEIPGKKAEIPGKRAEIPGQIHHDSKMKTWSGRFFLEMVSFILKWVNLQKIVRN